MKNSITLYTANTGLLLWETRDQDNPCRDKLYVSWDDIPKLAAELLEQYRQHAARELHGEAIAARAKANTPWDSPSPKRTKGTCAPSLRLSD